MLERIEDGKRLLSRLIFLLFAMLTVVNLYGNKLQVEGLDVDLHATTNNISLKGDQKEEQTGEFTEESEADQPAPHVNVNSVVVEIETAYKNKDYQKVYDLAMSISDDPTAQYYLGEMNAWSGYGVNLNYFEAVKWFRKSAEGGNTDAMTNLGFMYHYGTFDFPDYAEALKWYQMAVEGGNARAMFYLGDLYELLYGIKGDYTEAVKWYRKGAECGNLKAMFSLGKMYMQGLGVEQDYVEALKWYRKAADGGFKFANEYVSKLENLIKNSSSIME